VVIPQQHCVETHINEILKKICDCALHGLLCYSDLTPLKYSSWKWRTVV